MDWAQNSFLYNFKRFYIDKYPETRSRYEQNHMYVSCKVPILTKTVTFD
jgi:hypothetical protein